MVSEFHFACGTLLVTTTKIDGLHMAGYYFVILSDFLTFKTVRI